MSYGVFCMSTNYAEISTRVECNPEVAGRLFSPTCRTANKANSCHLLTFATFGHFEF